MLINKSIKRFIQTVTVIFCLHTGLLFAVDAQDINTGDFVKFIDISTLKPGFTISYLDYKAGDIRYGVIQDIIVIQNRISLYVYDHASGSVREFYIEISDLSNVNYDKTKR